jgi:hypothetical protein
MRTKLIALAAGGLLLSGCYHVTVVHSTPGVMQQAAAAPVTVEKPFSHSFVNGLVPPAEMNVKEQCPRGVAKVETKQSFVNGVVSGLTNGLYTPISVKVTCTP